MEKPCLWPWYRWISWRNLVIFQQDQAAFWFCFAGLYRRCPFGLILPCPYVFRPQHFLPRPDVPSGAGWRPLIDLPKPREIFFACEIFFTVLSFSCMRIDKYKAIHHHRGACPKKHSFFSSFWVLGAMCFRLKNGREKNANPYFGWSMFFLFCCIRHYTQPLFLSANKCLFLLSCGFWLFTEIR